jgi:hypothetical protein
MREGNEKGTNNHKECNAFDREWRRSRKSGEGNHNEKNKYIKSLDKNIFDWQRWNMIKNDIADGVTGVAARIRTSRVINTQARYEKNECNHCRPKKVPVLPQPMLLQEWVVQDIIHSAGLESG